MRRKPNNNSKSQEQQRQEIEQFEQEGTEITKQQIQDINMEGTIDQTLQ
ncbi:hypothetical protein [Paraliobacillus sp. PM-2]|nr:hypothetical protein [Paraliobacillus sp. PM-2]